MSDAGGRKRADFEMVVFSDDWWGLPFSCKHLLQHFLPEVPLTWVQTIGVRTPRVSVYDIRRMTQKVWHWASGDPLLRTHRPENLRVVNPIQIPYNHLEVIRQINQHLLLRSLHLPGSAAPDCPRVLLTTLPFLSGVVGSAGDTFSVYYRVDDYSELPGVRKDFMRQAEADLISKVDMVVATSEKLLPGGDHAAKAHYLPHGVDFEHFALTDSEGSCSDPLGHIPRPRVGFFGMIGSWIDLTLIHSVSRRRPDWNFVLIGPLQLEQGVLPRSSNIHYIGTVSYDQLPCYARAFDVALIPFKINALTLAVNPLKLLEYFSIGLPVVSTPLPEVMKYAQHLWIADTEGDFEVAITQALSQDTPVAKAARRKVARENGWAHRAATLRAWIEQGLCERGHGDL